MLLLLSKYNPLYFQSLAQRAASKVVVKYEDLPAIVTMDEAILHDSFYSMGTDNNITRGDPSKVLHSKETDDVIEGEVRIGGQEHFYLETNVVLVRMTKNCFHTNFQ